MAGLNRKTVYELVLDVDGNVKPELLKMLGGLRKSFDEIDIGGVKLSKSFLQMGKDFDFSVGSITNGMNAIESGAVSVGAAFGSLGIGLAMGAAQKGIEAVKWGLEETYDTILKGIDKAGEYEVAMAKVAKVTDGLRDGDGGYTPLYAQYHSDLLELSTKRGMSSAVDLAAIMEQGAMGGIGSGLTDDERRKALLQYTTDTRMASVAFDTDDATMSAIFRDWQSKLGLDREAQMHLADQINELGNLTNSNAVDLAKIVTESGSWAKIGGLKLDEVAAISSVLGAGGFSGSAEPIGTTISNTLRALTGASGPGSKLRQDALASIGLSQSTVAKGMQKDGLNTFLDILERISKLDADKAPAVLGKLFGAQPTQDMSILYNNLPKILEAIKITQGEDVTGSMQREFDVFSNTYFARKQQIENILDKFYITVGDGFLGYISDFIDQHGDELNAGLMRVAEKFPEIADAVFKDGGLADQIINLLPIVISVAGKFIDEIAKFANDPIGYVAGWLTPNFSADKGKAEYVEQVRNDKSAGLLTKFGAIMMSSGAGDTYGTPYYDFGNAEGAYYDSPTFLRPHWMSETEPEYQIPASRLDWALGSAVNRAAGRAGGAEGGHTFQFIYQGGQASEGEARNFARWSFDEFRGLMDQYKLEKFRTDF